MSLRNSFKETTPIAVYDANQQKLIAIVASMVLAVKFIYGRDRKYRMDEFYRSIRTKKAIDAKRMATRIAVRHASKQQIEMLGSADFILLDEEYKMYTEGIDLVYNTTRLDLYKRFVNRVKNKE